MRRVTQPLIARNVYLGASLFPLIPIEDTQRNIDVYAHIDRYGRIAPKVHAEGGIGGPVGHREFVIGTRFIDRLHGGFQIGPFVYSDAAHFVPWRNLLHKIEWPCDVELLDGSSVVQQLQDLDFRRPQVYFGGLQIGLVCYAQQHLAVQVHPSDIPGFVAILADSQFMIEVGQILLCHIAHSLGLQSLHKCTTQIEEQSAFLVGQLGLCDGGSFLGALQTQLPFVLPFMQIAGRNRWQRFGERAVFVDRILAERIDLVEADGQIRVGTQIGRDLLVARLVDADARRQQGGIRLFEFLLGLLPGQGLLRGGLADEDFG